MVSTLAPSPVETMADKEASTTVRIDSELVRKMRVICSHTPRMSRQLKLSEYLDDLIRAAVESRYEQVLDQVADERPGRRKKKPGE